MSASGFRARYLGAALIAVAVIALSVALWRGEAGDSSPVSTDASRESSRPRAARMRTGPRRAPPRQAPPTSAASAHSSRAVEAGGPTPATALSAPPGSKPSRPEQLRMTVLQQAVLGDWVTVDERGSPCPPQNIRIVYDAPASLKQDYEKGAYFEPLGPAPADDSVEINGLLLCEGHTFLYRGFEAYFRPERGQWDVFPFPEIE